MSAEHPIIAVTGSSGAGTSATKPLFAKMFEDLGLKAVFVEGDSFHTYDRTQMQAAIGRAQIRGENFSHFGPAANLLDRLEVLFSEYGEHGTGMVRRYLHTDAAGLPAGTFTPWEQLSPDTDVLFYEGLHGGIVTDEVDVAQHVDLLIGMTPTVNLEWIQKIKRDTDERGHNPDDVAKTILRRMPDYVTYITPQFSRTDINFQRVPLVDTSNPFVVREIPRASESLVVVSYSEHSRAPADFGALLKAIPGAFMSRANTLVVPGLHMTLAMELVLEPAIKKLTVQRQNTLKTKS